MKLTIGNKHKIKHLAIILDGNGRWAEKKNYLDQRGTKWVQRIWIDYLIIFWP